MPSLDAWRRKKGLQFAPQPAACYTDAYVAQQALAVLQGGGSPLVEWDDAEGRYQAR